MDRRRKKHVENRRLRTPRADSGVVRLCRYRAFDYVLPDAQPDCAADWLPEGGRTGELLEMAKSGRVVDARADRRSLGHNVVRGMFGCG